MFTGEVIQGEDYKKVGDVSRGFEYLDPVIRVMVRQSPENRFRTIREVKEHLRARGNEFIELQKLNDLKRTVIPDSGVNDPLVINPLTVRDSGVDYRGGRLVVDLGGDISGDWVRLFQRTEPRDSLVDSEPDKWLFDGRRAILPYAGTAEELAYVLTQFKKWVAEVNEQYARMRQAEAAAHRRRIDEELRLTIPDEEKRQAILKHLRSQD